MHTQNTHTDTHTPSLLHTQRERKRGGGGEGEGTHGRTHTPGRRRPWRRAGRRATLWTPWAQLASLYIVGRCGHSRHGRVNDSRETSNAKRKCGEHMDARTRIGATEAKKPCVSLGAHVPARLLVFQRRGKTDCTDCAPCGRRLCGETEDENNIQFSRAVAKRDSKSEGQRTYMVGGARRCCGRAYGLILLPACTP